MSQNETFDACCPVGHASPTRAGHDVHPCPPSAPAARFPEIAAVSWEHPADRAALQALRAIPGVDEVIRKVLALLGGERGVRLLFQGNAVRVGPAQFPTLWHLHNEVVTTFDWPIVPELYVSQTPFFNAGAYGIDQPFIVIHSAAIELLDDDELRVLAVPRAGPRDERARALPDDRRHPRADQPRRASDARGTGGAADPARLSGVVTQVGAVRRPGRAARRAGYHGGRSGWT